MWKSKKPANLEARELLESHFVGRALHELVTASRVFPATARVDLQTALERLLGKESRCRSLKSVGIHCQYGHETVTISHVASTGHYPVLVGPLQYDEVDVGETVPARCLKQALWLCESEGQRFALILSPARKFGQENGVHVEVAVLPGEAGAELSRGLLGDIEKEVNQAGSYRGKVLSLEASDNYHGSVGNIRVHRLHPVKRDQIILPEKTLQLLERNVTRFVQNRNRLAELQMPVKKGLLFYGPPGTGKTHTIHYLASELKDHTTLLITAEQVGLLDTYMQLARFLQPVMVVLEDVDLIARQREEMRSGCEESLLNKLLNEMDGLREEAKILFVLTTNRPEHLEAALTSRPGRIDQAIEFPLPDDDGRRKLVHLYSRGLQIPSDVVETVVQKTKGASPAFIKELMRRSAQYLIESDRGGGLLEPQHVEAALDEILFSGGSLNVRLLGGATEAGA